MNNLKKKKGFTLVELMIVIVIVGILATWAIPKFMLSSSKAKMAEYKLLLNQIYELQDVYYQERDRYGATFDDIGFEIPKSKYFNFSMTSDSVSFLATATVKRNVKGPKGKNLRGKKVTVNEKDEKSGDPLLVKFTHWE